MGLTIAEALNQLIRLSEKSNLDEILGPHLDFSTNLVLATIQKWFSKKKHNKWIPETFVTSIRSTSQIPEQGQIQVIKFVELQRFVNFYWQICQNA